ncbi:MAG: GGDEF domain-containing protein [Thalassobaculum sp.]|uniref:GGDEF domain-containing protein n=1 Tax=Thalassobaculum sp. TaxID=2022740 RepID=UPI0032EF8425
MPTEPQILAAPLDGHSVRQYAEVTGMLARFNAALQPGPSAFEERSGHAPDTAEAEAALRLALVAMSEAQRRIERQEARIRELESLSVTDDLTGLFNRRGFDMHLGKALAQARRGERRGAVMMIDLDRFKQINDTYGHAAGDGFLQAVAGVLQADVRECDVVGRLGGDEFAVLMTDLERASCGSRARALTDRLNDHVVDWQGTLLPIKASVGFVEYGADDCAADVLQRADELMYLQKNARRSGAGMAN